MCDVSMPPPESGLAFAMTSTIFNVLDRERQIETNAATV
jgi:hypothetical protein